jgi:hypothetical protein
VRVPRAFVAAVVIAIAASPAVAEECVVWSEGPNFPAEEVVAYATGISREDVTDAAGNTLAEVAAVLRRDRENFHTAAVPGRGDEAEGVFADPVNLRLFDGASVIFYCDWTLENRAFLVTDILGARLESRVHVTVYARPDGTFALHIEAWG